MSPPNLASGSRSSEATQPFTVLLVDGNPQDRTLLRALLSQGTRPAEPIVECSRLAEAIEHLDEWQFDLVLLTLDLPDSTGLETVLGLRPHAPDAAVIVTAGFGGSDTAIEAVRSGAQDYLIKHKFTAESLARTIHRVLGRREAAPTDGQERRVASWPDEIAALESFMVAKTPLTFEHRNPLNFNALVATYRNAIERAIDRQLHGPPDSGIEKTTREMAAELRRMGGDGQTVLAVHVHATGHWQGRISAEAALQARLMLVGTLVALASAQKE